MNKKIKASTLFKLVLHTSIKANLRAAKLSSVIIRSSIDDDGALLSGERLVARVGNCYISYIIERISRSGLCLFYPGAL